MKPIIMSAGAALLAAVVAGSSPSSSAELAPRAPAVKESYQALATRRSANRVTIKFREGLKVRSDDGGLAGLPARGAAALATALRAAGVGPRAMKRLHTRPEAELDAERAEGQAETGEELADLNLYYVISLPPGANPAAVADRLNKLPFVEYAAPAPLPPPPPLDLSPKTPNFVSIQGYLAGSGVGVGALDANGVKGADGAGIRVVDIEYDWTLNHEDLEIPNSRVLTGGETLENPFTDNPASAFNHGTAVLGVIVGKKNAYGVTGITPAATPYVSPQVTVESGYTTARAITTGGTALRRGDVMIIEAQYFVCGSSDYGPIETLQDVFDAVSNLTARGVIVVAAAGNGGADLDRPGCGDTFRRSVRNSRAIIVGAGSSAAHTRLPFSTYGSRVDVQGWGESVTTTGYGDLFALGGVRQLYTSSFNGTSSATPTVAGAIIAIQGVRKACGLRPLSPTDMRTTLITTGTPQGPGVGHIGPLPRILPALRSTDAKSCVDPQNGPAVGRMAAMAE